jgi:superfamily II DNA or RNA helicase
MPRIFDNIDQSLLPALRETLVVSHRADFCVGYFNLRGWKQIDELVDRWSGGPGHCCRLLVGMQRLPQEELQDALSILHPDEGIDNQKAIRLKKRLAEEFRTQLMLGAPTDADEAGLRRLAAQLRAKKVVVKLFLRHLLHAKLYLLFRPDPVSPKVGYLGSSNLTFAGLAQQGELNIDVVDQDACQKLAQWFEDRWEDRWSIDNSKELLEIIQESWAREDALPPYYIYLKMAYHLSQEARTGLTEFRIPNDFGNKLFEFQTAAVKIAAHHLNKRGGVLIGDVVGLGKTLMATAVARIFEDDHDLETLIICPKNLVSMWEDYRTSYRLRGRVLSISRAIKELPKLRRYRLVLIDESHNLRNREGRRYRVIQDYIRANESKVILLSATPYNKTYVDLSNQLRLFIPEDADVGIRPENLLQSVERHILRNFVYLHAIEKGLPIPIGTQDASLLDSRFTDADQDLYADDEEPDQTSQTSEVFKTSEVCNGEEQFRGRAAEVYEQYAGPLKRRFRWLRPERFVPQLAEDLCGDARALLGILKKSGDWNPARDAKLNRLVNLITRKHPGKKVLVFTQFADTVDYLVAHLQDRGIARVAAATGDTENPTRLAWRFSLESNEKRREVPPDQELQVLVATDILSEGQNLQDAAIIVNYDLPWAIIRLIQRAGRVDRIGQRAEEILCYTFLPVDGVERIIRLRARVRQRLRENAEVVGTDEAFFDDDRNDQVVRDLFTEKAGILDGDAETEVDLGSYAFQIWKNAIDRQPDLQRIIPDLPNVVYSTKGHVPAPGQPEGVLAFVRTADGHDALAWLDRTGEPVTEAQFAILKAAECAPEAQAIRRLANHHDLVRKAVELIAKEEKIVGGQLGRPSGARFRTYERLKRYADEVKGTLFDSQQLRRAIEDIYNYPLRQVAVDTLNRQLRSGISDEDLAGRVVDLREEGRLSIIHDEEESQEPRIICSLGLSAQTSEVLETSEV